MKKVISILLAAAILSFATVAMADTSTGTVSNRTANEVFATSPDDVNSMPSFKAGDTVSFTISGVKAGDWITLLTYKNGEEPDNSTTQYIDQYTAEDTTQAVTYVIRDIGDGVYKLKIKANGNELYTVYYQVSEGDAPQPTILYGDVNSDGKVTLKDDAYLARHIAKWTGYETIDEQAADTNGDGRITIKDNAVLARYIAKWTGYEVLPYTGK